MATVYRICAACGQSTPLEARHCPHCGHDTQSGLPMRQSSNLPVVVGKAALPMLVTAGTLAARVLWKLLRERALPVTNATLQQSTRTEPIVKREDQPPATRSRRSIHIRTSWAVGDARGVWQQGQSEHHIEIED